jgi:exosortase A-associated hydrolase 2
MASSVSGHFLAGRQGPLFVLRRGPASGTRCVLVVPPFAEEMNKCRRMVTLLAMQLAQSGIVTVVPDLYGTGDSGGDFVDAGWALWQDDLARTARWCEDAIGPVTALLGIRLGCALAGEGNVLAAMPDLSRTVFWQPVLDGSRHLAQFMRLRVAASMASDVKESIADLRAELAAAGEIEISGYRISRGLVTEIEAVREPPVLPARLGAVDWFELVREIGQPVAPASARLIQATADAGVRIVGHAIVGDPFWAATEIVINDELVRKTCDSLLNAGPPAAGDPA